MTPPTFYIQYIPIALIAIYTLLHRAMGHQRLPTRYSLNAPRCNFSPLPFRSPPHDRCLNPVLLPHLSLPALAPPPSSADFPCPIYSYSANCNLHPTTPSEASRASSIEHPESAIRCTLNAVFLPRPSPPPSFTFNFSPDTSRPLPFSIAAATTTSTATTPPHYNYYCCYYSIQDIFYPPHLLGFSAQNPLIRQTV